MKNIPVFDTENGVATLILREIPYTQRAYIRLQSVSDFEKMAEECRDFCRMCGAEKIYATGHEGLEQYPLYTAVVEMRCVTDTLPATDACLFPVQEHTLGEFARIYNEKMKNVPNSAWMDAEEGKRMLEAGDGYFVHRAGSLIGIGRVESGKIRVVASLVPGGGREVVAALSPLAGETAAVEVATENRKAMALYESLGFVPVRELSRWYEIL